MKTRSIVGPFLFTFLIIFHAVVSIRIDGENHDQSTQFNEYFEIFSSRESINDSSDIEVGDLNTVHCNDDCKNLKTAKNNQTVPDCYNNSNEQMSHNPSHSNVSSRDDIDNQNLSDKDWFYKQSKQSSIESFESNDEIGQQQDIPDGFYRTTCPEFGRRMVDKITMLDGMVAAEHSHDHGRLLDVEDPLPVKKYVVKVDKRTYVSFRAAELRSVDGNGAVLEYLSVDAASNRVRVGCSWLAFAGNGTFKTNVAHGVTRGPYSVHASNVRGNVTARFHRGRRVAGSVRAGSFVVATPSAITAAINASVDARYRVAVERSVLSALDEATHRGLVARLKAGLNAPMEPDRWSSGRRDGAAALCDPAAWTGTNGRRPLDSVSYTRLGHRAYRMRFDVRLAGLVRWTGHEVRRPGSSVDFVANSVRIRAAFVRSVGGGHGCREIDVQVRVTGHVIPTGDQHVRSIDVQRSIAARLSDLLRDTVCIGSVPTDPVSPNES